MVRKLSTGVTVAVVVVTAFVAAVSPVSAKGKPMPETINIVAAGEDFRPGFTKDREPRAGEAFVFSGSLYEWAGRKRGQRIGRVELHVIATSERGGYETGVAFLPGGQILFAGFTPFSDVPVERQAVIGGTGRYVGARGSITLRDLPGGDSAAITLRLLECHHC